MKITAHKLVLLVCFFSIAFSLYEDCPGEINEKKVINTKAEQLMSVKHGKKFVLRDPANPEFMHIKVAVLEGSAYEMGYAMGQMFKKEIKDVIDGLVAFIKAGDIYWEHVIPSWMEHIKGLDYIEKVWLGLAYEAAATAHYTP